MFLTEIYNQKWKIVKNLDIRKIRIAKITKLEQDFHIKIMAVGLDNPDKEEAVIHCTFPRYIGKLSQNPFFTLKSVLVSYGLSEEENNRVLQVTGCIYDSTNIQIRPKMKMNLSKEEKERRALNLLKARQAKITKQGNYP